MHHNIQAIHNSNSIVWETIAVVMVITLLTFVIILFAPRKKHVLPNENNSFDECDDDKAENKKFWHDYYTYGDGILKYYDLYFYWKPLETWVSCEFYILNEKSKYIWYGAKDTDGQGNIVFGENSYLKKIFDIWIEEYSETGIISLKNFIGVIPEDCLKNIISDVFVKECYVNGDKIKRTFNYFEKIHGHSGRNERSNNNSSNINKTKKQAILAMKFFGFNKVPTFSEVKISYKKQAMMYHPDRPNGSVEKMQKINEQYDILKKYFEKQ